MVFRTRNYVLAAVVILMVSSGISNAQNAYNNSALLNFPVNQRIPFDLRPKQLEFRGFLYEPKITVDTLYDSNALAQSDNPQSDFILQISPSLMIDKHFEDHILKFGATAQINRYAELHDENTTQPEVFFKGALNNSGPLKLPFDFNYTKEVRQRRIPQKNGLTIQPGKIDIFNAETGFIRSFNRLSLGLMGLYESKQYTNEILARTNTKAVNDDLDRAEYRGTLKIKYEFPSENRTQPHHVLYTDIFRARQNYKRLAFTEGDYTGENGDRDITGFLSGIETRYKGLVFANIGAGYEKHSFDDKNLEDVDIFNLKASIDYNILSKLTLNLTTSSGISQDNGFLQGVKVFSAGFGGDYELQHDLYASANIRNIQYKFIDSTRNQEDDIIGELELKKLNSENLTSKASVVYQDRRADDPQFAFDRMTFMLGLAYQF
jgi:hypothetical protein